MKTEILKSVKEKLIEQISEYALWFAAIVAILSFIAAIIET
jgi:hypothetical protein